MCKFHLSFTLYLYLALKCAKQQKYLYHNLMLAAYKRKIIAKVQMKVGAELR